MAKDHDEQSLGDQPSITGAGGAEDQGPQSLGDQATFAGGALDADSQSLGDQSTMGGGGGTDSDMSFDDGMEIVDLSARYTTEGVLGKGGMGEVLLALDTRLNRKVAIKQILGDAASSRTAVNRFISEAKAIARLDHDNIVDVYDYGRSADGPFLVMQYIDGGSLLDRCREVALPMEEAIGLTCQLCDALDMCHRAGIIHRDIKPANILMTRDGSPRLTDFGLVKEEQSDSGHTMAGAVLGTLDFMPPEQRRDAALTDARSDLWSLAATLYQMVTGKSPKIIRFKNVPESLQDVLGKALEDDKDDRYQTARAFRDALQGCLTATAPVPEVAVDLSAGECPKCHAKNEADRKFCRGCGESLRVPCLKCSENIPVWENFCAECGGNQKAGIASRVEELEAQRSKAEAHRSEYRFEDALKIARSLAAVDDERIAGQVPWAADFFKATKAEWERQRKSAVARFEKARMHRDAFDYASALQAMRSIPETMQTEHMHSFLALLESDYKESRQLLKAISDRLRRRDLSGLLTQVDRALELRGDRADLRTLRKKLQQRRNSELSDCHGNDVIRNSVGMLLVPVRVTNSGIAHAETDTQVSTQPLLIGVFPVTQQQYEHIMQSNPSRFKGDNRPVETVTFHEAEIFCRTLSELPAELSSGRCYRLPTEPEWEHACRAGTQTTFSFGEDDISCWDGVDDAGQAIGGTLHSFFEYGWCKENSDRQSHPVGLKAPNAWGLFDMHGNVAEWCTNSPAESPDAKPVRGGSWQNTTEECSSVSRTALLPQLSRSMVGFRVACDIN
jgi:hypothetical protein